MTYNEVGSFNGTCDELLGVLDALRVNSELLVVDDGSTDGTERLIDAVLRRHPHVRLVRHDTNRGLGGVYRTGFREARGEFVTFFPADGQFPASIITDFLPRLEEADFVLGYLPERRGAVVGRLLSLVERLLYRLILGAFPRFQGIVMFRRSLLSRYQLRSTGRGWAVLMEFILRCSKDGVRIRSVPTAMRPRVHGRSKVNNLRTMLSNLRQLLALRSLLA